MSPAQEAVTLLVQDPGALLVSSEGQGGQAGAEQADNVVTLHNRSELRCEQLGSDSTYILLTCKWQKR